MFVLKFVKCFLFIYFIFMSIVILLFDSQIVLPTRFYPKILVEQYSKQAHENNDILLLEKSHFFVGLIWLKLLFQWPLCIANLYGLLTNKSWLKTTCLIYGVSASTAMVATLSELIMSSEKPLSIHGPFFVFGAFALIPILYGLFAPYSTSVTRPSMARKKRV